MPSGSRPPAGCNCREGSAGSLASGYQHSKRSDGSLATMSAGGRSGVSVGVSARVEAGRPGGRSIPTVFRKAMLGELAAQVERSTPGQTNAMVRTRTFSTCTRWVLDKTHPTCMDGIKTHGAGGDGAAAMPLATSSTAYAHAAAPRETKPVSIIDKLARLSEQFSPSGSLQIDDAYTLLRPPAMSARG